MRRKSGQFIPIVAIVALVVVLFLLVYPLSTAIYVSTGISKNDGAVGSAIQITTQVQKVKIPLFTYLLLAGSIVSTQSDDNSPIFDISYKVFLDDKSVYQASGTQIKANVLTVRLPYNIMGSKKGNVTVEIPNFSYIENKPIEK